VFFHDGGDIAKPTHLMHVEHMGGCGLDLTMIYVNTRVLEFWVMEITNIYDF
jgi:hypothetical protein